MANRVDPDETPRYAASHLGLHCLLRPECPNTQYGTYGIHFQLEWPISDDQHRKRPFCYTSIIYTLCDNVYMRACVCLKCVCVRAPARARACVW